MFAEAPQSTTGCDTHAAVGALLDLNIETQLSGTSDDSEEDDAQTSNNFPFTQRETLRLAESPTIKWHATVQWQQPSNGTSTHKSAVRWVCPSDDQKKPSVPKRKYQSQQPLKWHAPGTFESSKTIEKPLQRKRHISLADARPMSFSPKSGCGTNSPAEHLSQNVQSCMTASHQTGDKSSSLEALLETMTMPQPNPQTLPCKACGCLLPTYHALGLHARHCGVMRVLLVSCLTRQLLALER